MEVDEFMRAMNAHEIMTFQKEENMERYKSVVVKKSGPTNGRYGFQLQDNITWVSCFLRRNQNPTFQAAIAAVQVGMEYVFDCERNNQGYLNIKGIQPPGYPTIIPEKLAGGPQPGFVQAPATPLQPIATTPPVLQPGVAPNPLAQGEMPAGLMPLPETAPGSSVASQPTEVRIPNANDREREKTNNITRQKAHDIAANLMVAIIEKGTLPEDVNKFVQWVVDMTRDIAVMIADSILEIPFDEGGIETPDENVKE
jgi:hypothetical protein